ARWTDPSSFSSFLASQIEALRQLLPLADHRAPLLPSLVSPPLVSVRQLRMAVEEPANGAPHGWGDQGQEEETHGKEDELRHDGDEDPDDAEDEEEDREDEVPDFVPPRARPAMGLGRSQNPRRERGHRRLQ